MRSVLVAAVGSMLALGSAFAAEPETVAGSKSLAYLQGGYSAGGTHDGAAIGGQLVQGLSSRFALEAAAAYVPGRGMRAGATSATLGILFHLRPTSGKAVPYLTLGGGIHHGPARMQDWMRAYGVQADGYRPGMMGNAPGYGPQPGMPMYGRTDGGPWGTRDGGSRNGMNDRGDADDTSTDPAFVAGGGIRIDLGSSLFLRPDARATLVAGDGETRVVGTYALSIGYGF